MYLFRMCGRIVQIYRYQAYHLEIVNPEEEPELVTSYYPTLEEAEAVTSEDDTLTELDTSTYEWMDGIEVPDVDDTYAEAVKIYDMGKEAYMRQLSLKKNQTTAQLRADLDYVMLMEGL